MMSAVEIIRQVYVLGGRLHLEGTGLVIEAPKALPENLRLAIKEHKPSIMVALGAPLDDVVSGILADIRPHLPPALRRLPDDRILALVNWSIMAAWKKALRRLNEQ